jgi:deazaflavin-dependent oxidoreductase (nitroreductase family)
MSDFNQGIIEEFRENAGKVGGAFEGAPVLLLHTTGRKTGKERVNPVVYRQLDDGWAISASKGGAPTNPDWFGNLMANPETSIEIGTDTVDVEARIAEPDERSGIWEAQKQVMPGFADYERKTDREIPVVILRRR